MGLLGPSKDQQEEAVHELGVVLFGSVAEAADEQLQARGIDSKSARGPIQSRVHAAIAQHSNRMIATFKYADVKRFSAHPEQWAELVGQTAAEVEREAAASLAARPPIPSSATGEARYGPHWEEITSFLGRLHTISTERWVECCGAHFATATMRKAERFRQLKFEALYAKAQVAEQQGLDDQVAWAWADAEDVGRGLEARFEGSGVYFQAGQQAYSTAAPGTTQDAATAASTIVVRDHLNTEHYSVLVSDFMPEILGQAAYHEAQQARARQQAR